MAKYGHTVLIVSEHAKTVSVCRRELEGRGFSVVVCGAVGEAESAVAGTRPDLLVVAAGFRSGDVKGLCRRAREDLGSRVLVTLPPRADAAGANVWNGLCDGWLTQPFRASEFGDLVEALIGGAGRPVPEQCRRPASVAVGAGAEAPPVTEIAGCRIERVLGRGAMGTVWLGRHLLLDVPVAIKFAFASAAGWGDDEAARFMRGARAAAGVDHPSVVRVLNAGREADFYYLVQRYVEGRTLRDVMASRGPLGEAEVWGLMRDLAGALAAVHGSGVVHRDVKPGNIIVTAAGRALLTDFGLACGPDGSDVSSASAVVGTPYYMAPEQCEGRAVDGRADLYSLGATAYHALTGRRPIPGGTPLEVLRNHLEYQPVAVRESAPDVSEGLSEIIMRLLAKAPGERFASARALSAALDRVRSGER